MTRRQGWLVLWLLAMLVACENRGRDWYICGALFFVVSVVFLACWFLGKD